MTNYIYLSPSTFSFKNKTKQKKTVGTSRVQLRFYLSYRINLLDSKQYGFKITQLWLPFFIEALRLARAASKSSVLLLLAMSAAFDTVNH